MTWEKLRIFSESEYRRDLSRCSIGLSQSTCVDKISKKFSMENSKKGNVPIHHRYQMSRVPSASAIGSIMYDVLCTRPDVLYALSMVNRYQEDPELSRWTTVENILIYLRNTEEMLLDSEQELKLRDSEQDTRTLSTCKCEYIATSEASKDVTWIRSFIGDLRVVPNYEDPIEIDLIISSGIEDGKIVVERVSLGENPVDPFTKGLAHDRHSMHAKTIDMRNDVKF
ncbi:hypothetical protein LXL04_020403 [Taraxacum kok-saghyz]